MTKAENNQWWRGGVIYQIYPRSFADANGDGVGDLRGITAKLGYVAELGVDAIWLSPFFKSPMKDFGYDVSDYCDVDPLFGSLDDFKNLMREAKAQGLKVIIDQVLSHTSDQHPWFDESRRSRDNPKANWYVWADAKPDGTPPTNWLSIFGGSAWQWDTRRRQYYLHNFLSSQPDLNFHEPAVVAALLETVKFWLDLGVDGFRLDTAPFYFHDSLLRDNPPRHAGASNNNVVADVNPYAWQRHIYDKERPENIGFLQALRALVDRYPNTTLVGEIGTDDSLATMAEYTRGDDRLHMAYSFDLLGPAWQASYLYGLLAHFAEKSDGSWPSWALSNHDVIRLASRWDATGARAGLLRLAAVLQMTLRGSPCLYQGDELGLTEADVPFELLQDPPGIAMWPEYKGRDGCRTPMPWQGDAPDLGFGSSTPWLPLTEAYRPLAADRQRGVPNSHLSFYQDLLRWRRGLPDLIQGEMSLGPRDERVLTYWRTLPNASSSLLCVLNFSDEVVTLDWPSIAREQQACLPPGVPAGELRAEGLSLPAWGVWVGRVARDTLP